jgi:hypothetical protein
MGNHQVPVLVKDFLDGALVVVAGGFGREEVTAPSVPAEEGEGVADTAAVFASN